MSPEKLRRRRVVIGCAVEVLEGRMLLAADFTLATFSDTQYTVESFPATFKTQTAWIAAHKADPNYNVAFFTHQGDMLRRGYSDYQAQNASDALANLDAAGVPYAVAIGNHDYDNQFDDLDRHVSSANFTHWFGDARYRQQLSAGEISEYGSSLDQRNHYHVFTAAGRRFLVLSLEWQVPTAAQQWAQSVLDAHPDLPVIVSTHEYLAGSAGSRTTGTPVDAAQIGAQNGSSLWTNFVSRNNQIFLVLSGHTGATWNRTVTNSAGNTVIEAAADFEGAQANGGDGWMQTLQFTLGNSTTPGSLTITSLKPTSATTQQVGSSTTYSINFAQRFALGAPVTPPATPPANAAPVGVEDAVETPESKSVTFDSAANDGDPDGAAPLKAILTTLPAHGALYVNDNGTFTYTPDPMFVGLDTLTYVASDGVANSAPVTVTVNVRPAAPVYYYPTAETTVAGTRTGSIANLKASDNVVESVREVISTTAADVDQRYTFTGVTPGADMTLGLNAWRSFSNPGTGDEYHPQYSTNGSTWSDLTQIVPRSSKDVTRTRFEANEPYQLWALPATLAGTVYVRLTDVNPGGTETVDTLTVDEIFLRAGVTFPTVSIAATADGAETPADNRPAVFTVSRGGAGASIRNPLTVSFTLGGTATAGDDYVPPANYSVTIPAGAGATTFSITPINDGVVEDAETVDVTLTPDAAYDIGARSATAAIADYAPDTTAPSSPTLTGVTTTSTTAVLSWAAATDDVGVVAYDVYRNGSLLTSVPGSANGYTDTGLPSNTAFAYAVTARDDAGNVSAVSDAVSATTRLPAPTGLTVGRVKISGNKYGARLNWSDTSSGESGFHIYSSRDGVNWTLIATTPSDALAYTTGQLASGSWYFKVASFNGNGDSDGIVKSLSI